jgi:hypothetical protein
MKMFPSLRQRDSGQIMVEACIGLALMAFAWIIITYSLYLADNQIRTEMAARYAAWYAGNNNGTHPTAANIDQYFFFQSGLSTVSKLTPALIPDALAGQNPTNAVNDNSDGNGPFKVQITFGVTDPNNSSNPFPFDLLATHVPLMTNSMMAVYSVNSSCQWDGDSDTWNTWSAAAKGIWATISGNAGAAGKIFSGLF